MAGIDRVINPFASFCFAVQYKILKKTDHRILQVSIDLDCYYKFTPGGKWLYNRIYLSLIIILKSIHYENFFYFNNIHCN
ncbi:MAG: hypothetical protein JWR09_3927 [Mucilaginibacter sp.]|nr:hypothetical protein [Mucilaginibacter sp.]